MKSYHLVCVKWGERYKPEYVNALYHMSKRHCSLPFTFHCITDCDKDLLPDINILSIPEAESSITGWWHKVSLFKPDFYGLSGTVLLLDLDMVILQSIDEFFTYAPGQTIMTKGFFKHPLSSCMMRVDIGTDSHIWTDFFANKDDIMERLAIRGDQYWILEASKNHIFWPKAWVVNYKEECKYRLLPVDLGLSPDVLHRFSHFFGLEATEPKYGKVLAFQGKPDIHDILEKPWGRYRAAPWLKDLWR